MENILFYELGKCFGVKYSSFSNQVRSLRDKSVAKVFTKAFLKVKSIIQGIWDYRVKKTNYELCRHKTILSEIVTS